MSAIKYNLKSLNRLIEFNELFFDLAIQSFSNGFETSAASQRNIFEVEHETKIMEEEKDNNNIKKQHTEDLTKIPADLGVYNLGISEPQADLEGLEDLYHSILENRPISMLNNLSSENAELLNSYGINTIHDLKEGNISAISRGTGIPRTELNNLRRQIQCY